MVGERDAREPRPGFWDALVWQHGQGRIVSVDRVKAELERSGDDLATWVTGTMPHGCFVDTDMDVVTQAYADAIVWVMGQAQFTEAAKAEFADAENADAWVIAFAKAMDATIDGLCPQCLLSATTAEREPCGRECRRRLIYHLR